MCSIATWAGFNNMDKHNENPEHKKTTLRNIIAQYKKETAVNCPGWERYLEYCYI